jgi:hypothetical protein
MKIFLSHSSLDKPFVKRLHEALTLLGISTFFDERDIKVGDDIRQLIELGIDQSTHLIYVISKESLKSRWVQDELSMAKFKAMSGKGVRILPVLIEKVTLPVGISHIKYADFTNWEFSEQFYAGFNDLLNAFELKGRDTVAGDISLVLENFTQFVTWEITAREYSLFADGCKDGFIVGTSVGATYYLSRIEYLSSLLASQAEAFGIFSLIEDIENFLASYPAERLVNIRQAVVGCKNDVAPIRRNRKGIKDIEDVVNLSRHFRALANYLGVLIREIGMLKSVSLR